MKHKMRRRKPFVKSANKSWEQVVGEKIAVTTDPLFLANALNPNII
jgi:hypothetical protein